MPDISEALYVGVAGDAPRTPPARIALGDVDRVEIGRTIEARSIKRGNDKTVTLALPDPRMSTHHARLSRSGDGWIIEDLNSMNGTLIGALRVKKRPLDDGDVILVGHTALMFFESGGEGGDLDGLPPAVAPGLLTLSPALAERYRDLAAAPVDKPIEIRGEPGTGSELVAFAAHAMSRRPGQFATINCGASPAADLDPAFEHVFRSAIEGTVFLDDLHLLPREAQAPLAKRIEASSARIITSTCRDLDVEIGNDGFEANLRERVRGFAIELPALRRRREDLGLLVAALLDIHAKKRTVTLSGEAVSALYVHDWPLNIRELERSLLAALAVTPAEARIELEHLPASVGSTEPLQQQTVFRETTAEERSLRDQLTSALARHEGNIAAVGREMGKDPTQIRRWMKKFNLKRE